MKQMTLSMAIDDALASAMATDDRVVVIGEDVQGLHPALLARFGQDRMLNAPISEGAFVGAAVAAAMSGLRPVVEIMLIDFVGVAMDAILNHASKISAFTGGRWEVPLVIRSACGGGYGDGGQHEQSLWGWLAHIPGLSVVVPSNPADAGNLMITALEYPGPVVFLEHKLISDSWLEVMGGAGRRTVSFDVPPAGRRGRVPSRWSPLPVGKATVRRPGQDLTAITVGVGVHRCLQAAEILGAEDVSMGVVDLRWVSPLDTQTIRAEVAATGRALVVDEDYRQAGLSGEIAAVLLENGVLGGSAETCFGRVCTETTIPFGRHLEDRILPNTERIVEMARSVTGRKTIQPGS